MLYRREGGREMKWKMDEKKKGEGDSCDFVSARLWAF